jgi:NAD(P)-dependent dehydrogenase (short-subunit alcohol dehydrogenase family)
MRRPEDGDALPEAARSRGGRLRVEALDVNDPASIRIPEGLRLLVNNAGVDPPYLPVEHLSMNDWRAVFETNFFGLLEVTRRAIPVLRGAGGGVVCNITSASLLAPVPFFAAYRASKAAVSALGETLRAELANFGIRVVEILPGPIETDMLRDSDRVPEASAHAAYRAQAELSHQGRKSVSGNTTPADVAASAVADAIHDDDAPLRNPGDPLGAALLSTWSEGRDEAFQRSLLAAFVPEMKK